MSAVAGAGMPSASAATPATGRKASAAGGETKEKEKRYKCQFCNRAFSRSEHRSRHERSRKYTFLMDVWWGSAQSHELHAMSKVGGGVNKKQFRTLTDSMNQQTRKSDRSNV